jgi:hypothetical protein
LPERSDGGRGSGAALPASLPPARACWRAGVLGMPGRCSQENGTAEARSGERKRWWNGDGAGEKKERPEDEEEPRDEEEDEVAEADAGVVAEEDGGRSCRRRRRRVVTEGACGGSGDGVEEAGLGIALQLCSPWRVVLNEAVRSLRCGLLFYGWGWRGDGGAGPQTDLN